VRQSDTIRNQRTTLEGALSDKQEQINVLMSQKKQYEEKFKNLMRCKEKVERQQKKLEMLEKSVISKRHWFDKNFYDFYFFYFFSQTLMSKKKNTMSGWRKLLKGYWKHTQTEHIMQNYIAKHSKTQKSLEPNWKRFKTTTPTPAVNCGNYRTTLTKQR
jgi:hypothetical protein